MNIDELSEKILEVCIKNNWSKDWSRGGCYIHLEVSEFIESLRGKGDDSPTVEAADVIFTLFAVLANYGIKPSEVMKVVESKIKYELEK